MDSSILIRTADINKHGALRISTGATLVRDSVARSEALETRVKAAGLLSALGVLQNELGITESTMDNAATMRAIGQDSLVNDVLRSRNRLIAEFWLTSPAARHRRHSMPSGRKVLVLDAEDTFTAMICHQLNCLGLDVTLISATAQFETAPYDLIVLGPGPGDPNDEDDERVSNLQNAIETLLKQGKPFLAICLSHQILCRQLGLEVTRKTRPNQGTQKQIILSGKKARVGFYNAFSATHEIPTVTLAGGGQARLTRDTLSNEIHAIHGPSFISFQFHPESILTQYGDRLLSEAVAALTQ